MEHIYNELRSHKGKLTEFAHVLVDKNMYADTKNAIACMRNNVKHREDIQGLYNEWKGGKFVTKDVEKYNKKVNTVFKEIKRRNVKQELIDIRDTLEEALMLVTLAIKNNNIDKCKDVKTMIQSSLYGDKND